MSTKRKRETWTIGKDAPIDVDSEGAGDPIEHQKQVARALYEKRKQQGSYGASDNDDAAGLHVVVLSSDEDVKPSHPSQDEQLAEYRRVKRAKHDTNGATDASASAADASASAAGSGVQAPPAITGFAWPAAPVPAAAVPAPVVGAMGAAAAAAAGGAAGAPAAVPNGGPAAPANTADQAAADGRKALDEQQQKVVELSASGANLYICGGAGSGKSFTLTQAILYGDGTNAVMGQTCGLTQPTWVNSLVGQLKSPQVNSTHVG